MSKFDNMVHTAQMQDSAAAAISREIPVELLRASLPHTNEHQRKQLLNFCPAHCALQQYSEFA
jgi:DNA topoisomerase 2-associated protein PAT1